jgi:hypothetical protein
MDIAGVSQNIKDTTLNLFDFLTLYKGIMLILIKK